MGHLLVAPAHKIRYAAAIVRVLLVEDDVLVGDAVRRALAGAGFAVDLVATADTARAALQADEFDLLVCDIGLPREDGLHFVRSLRQRGQSLPILMLTARDALTDRVSALDLGADDYLTKPFQPAELIARARALIRRANAVASSQMTFGRLELDLAHKQVSIAGEALSLSQREWSILECLILNAGRIVSKDKLMSAIVGFDEELTLNAVEVYVSRLRAKIGDAAPIRAVRGMGYRIDESGEKGKP
jgi:two-component system, OmpR family, response regulator